MYNEIIIDSNLTKILFKLKVIWRVLKAKKVVYCDEKELLLHKTDTNDLFNVANTMMDASHFYQQETVLYETYQILADDHTNRH